MEGGALKKVIIFGNQELSELLYYYLKHDSEYEVVGFTVDGAYLKEETFSGLPIVPFESVETIYPPTTHLMSMLLGYRNVNKFRATKYAEAKEKGYRFARYVSSHAVVWPNVVIGENSFVLERAILQPFSSVGNNVVVSPTSFIGHHSVVKDHCFISSGITMLGHVTVEPYNVLGAGVTIMDGSTIAQGCIVGGGSVISKDTVEFGVYTGSAATLHPKSSREIGRILTWANDTRQG